MLVVEAADDVELDEGMLAHAQAGIRPRLVNPSSGSRTVVAIRAAGEHERRDGEAVADWSDEAGSPPAEVPPADGLP